MNHKTAKQDHQSYAIAGWALIGAGLVFVLDQMIATRWLSLLVLPILGCWGFVAGIIHRRMLWIVPGGLVAGVGMGLFFILNPLLDMPFFLRLGLVLLSAGLGFLSILFASKLAQKKPAYWALIPGLIIAAAGLPFLIDRVNIFEFVLYIVTATGLSLLLWGCFQRLMGLIIPGCLLAGIGPGIYFAWSGSGVINGLTETGIMLVWFALGWGLITIALRVVTERFVWWPLIPGALLAVVGWGLYIGGDPGNALSFIGNTGSIGLFIFGVYLLLLRRSFKD
jgi:hypothetical protein